MKSLAILLLIALAGTACGGSSFEGAIFTSVTGSVELSGGYTLRSETQQAQDYPEDDLYEAFLAPVEGTKSGKAAEFRLETADRNVMVILNLFFEGTGRFELTEESGSLHLLVGDTCRGASSDMSACDWYADMFYSRGCTVDVRRADNAAMAGSVECLDLGANCLVGQRGANGVCLEGRSPGTVMLRASFHLKQPDRTKTAPRMARD